MAIYDVSRVRRFTWLVVWSCLTAACADESADEPPPASEQQAQVAADWIHPQCAAAGLQPPAMDTCAGPWSFGYRDLARSFELCGNGACLQHKTCESWHRDTEGDWLGAVRISRIDPGAILEFRCKPNGTNCRGTPPNQVASTCATKASLYRTTLLNTALAGLPSSVTSALAVTSSHTIIDQGQDIDQRWTVWRCDYHVTGYPMKGVAAKPVCGCEVYEPAECERSSGTIVTLPGQLRPSTPGAPTQVGDRREFASPPVCQTCDELPFDTEAAAQAKAQCLSQRLVGAQGELRQSLVARLQLLYQLAGEHLTAAQAGEVRALYGSEPEASVACRAPLELPAVCGADTALRARAQLCGDLVSNPHTSRAAAEREFEACLGQVATFASRGDECRLAVRDTSDGLAQGVLRKAQPSFTGELAVALGVARERLDAWWQAAALLAGGEPAWLYERSSEHLRWLWARIEAERMPLPSRGPNSNAEAATLLADLENTRLTSDAEVLSALFAPGQLATPPLLSLGSDALQALSDRLRRLMPLHDVGCRISGCKLPALRVSATSELVRILASLPDQAAFTAALAASPRLQAELPAVYAALLRVRDQHGYLSTAWAALGHPQPFSELLQVGNPPPEAAALAAIVREASSAWQSYQASGSFSPWRLPRVTTSTLRKGELLSFLDAQIAAVTFDRTAYLGARKDTLDDVLVQISQGNALQLTNARWVEASERMIELGERIDAISQREAQETVARADFQRGFEQLMASGAVDAASAYQVQTVHPGLTARASDAHYLVNTPTELARDRFAMASLRAGETLRARISGNWGPDCALRAARMIGPREHVARPITVDSAVTGPEGYWTTWQQGEYRSHSTAATNGRNHQISLTMQSCAGGMSAGNGSTICVEASLSRYWNYSSTSGSGGEERRGSTFNSGLRLPGTPFPDAPAGALLAVITRKDEVYEYVDVQVLSRDALITAPAGAAPDAVYDVHLVVNDAAAPAEAPACHADSSALSIELVRAAPLGNVAQALGQAMAQTLVAFDSRAATFLRQGELTAAEANALRSEAWVRLREQLPEGVGLANLPAELRQYFEAGLERELASLARRAERRSLERAAMRLAMELDSIGREQGNLEEQSRLRHLIPRWRLRDLAGGELADTVERLADAIIAHVAPAFELHDPATLQTLRLQQGELIEGLIEASVAEPLEDVVAGYLQLASATRAALAGASLEPPATQRRTIIVAIPRPLTAGQTPWTSEYRSVSPATAEAFWQSAFETPASLSARAQLTLSPRDLYTGPGGFSHLSCQDQAPVVRHLGLYLATDGWLERLVDMEVAGIAGAASSVTFPVPGKMYTFGAGDPAGLPIAPRVFNGDTAEVLSAANFGSWPVELDAGAGISPFTSFQLNLQGFQAGVPRTVFDHSRALLLVFEVERKVSVSPAFVPGVCVLEAP